MWMQNEVMSRLIKLSIREKGSFMFILISHDHVCVSVFFYDI